MRDNMAIDLHNVSQHIAKRYVIVQNSVSRAPELFCMDWAEAFCNAAFHQYVDVRQHRVSTSIS